MKKASILRYKADYRTLALIAIYFGVTYTGYFLFWHLSWAILIPWAMLSCVMSFIMAALVHNTIHSPIFRKKSWNKNFQLLLSLAYGHSMSAYVPGHNLSHHLQTQTPKDTIRTYRLRFKWHLLNQLLFSFVVLPEIMQQEKEWVKKMKKEKPHWVRQYYKEMAVVMTVKIGLLLLNPIAAIMFLWIPHFYGTWGILATNMFQHDGCDEDHPYNHSRTFKSKMLNFFTCNNGYHGAHHDKPGLHWSLLPKYHKENIEPHIHPNLNRNLLITYLWEAYIWPGKRVDYLGNPVKLPPKDKTGDWIADVNVKSQKVSSQLGAEQ